MRERWHRRVEKAIGVRLTVKDARFLQPYLPNIKISKECKPVDYDSQYEYIQPPTSHRALCKAVSRD
jgi:hypothetical protein